MPDAKLEGGAMAASPAQVIGVVGGTGKLGSALALRLAHAGHRVTVGSRDPERAVRVAVEISERLGVAGAVGGDGNAAAASGATVVVVTVPFEAQQATVRDLVASVGNRVVISTAVPMTFSGGRPVPVPVAEGSAAEQLAALLPAARVVGALQTVSSATLGKLDRDIGADILLTADDEGAKAIAAAILSGLSGARVVDAGPLRNARVVEQLTVLLLSINARVRRNTGVRITNLPDELAMAAPAPRVAAS